MADGDGVEDALGSIAGAEVAAALAMEAVAQDEGNSFLSAFGTESPGRDHIVDEVRRLMKSIVEARPNVPAALLNRFASIVEQEEARYQQKLGFPQNSTRSSHTIGKLLVTIRDDDDFFDMLTSSLLLEGAVSSRAAAARALLTCMSCWAYTCTFEDAVLSMIKQLVMEDLEKSCSEGPNFRSKDKNANAKDSEVLSTYAIGLFACALSGTDTAEEILSSGLPAKFMRHLRLWTLGESGKSDHGHGGDGKANGYKSREEVRIRARQPTDAVEKRAISFEGDTDASGRMIDDHQSLEEEEADDAFTDERRRRKERNEGKSKPPGNYPRDENDISDRPGGRSRGKSRVTDGGDIERSARKEKGRPKADQTLPTAEDASKVYMADKVDISVSARRAVLAAQNEAKSANAPDEAIKAAGDAAAELVKTAALEALAQTDDIEAVLTAAEGAANSVVDAGATVVRKEDQPAEQATAVIPENLSVENEVDDHALDWESLAFLKARYCVQCLEKLGEYIDILGPVLQERGVEVCLELLRRHSRASDSVRDMAMVSDVLRLVCALAAHRKFAAVFVDLGGMQQLLATPRLPQTYVGISLCLFAVASLQGVMERVCTLSPSVVQDTVALAFQLLECSQDTARKNAALFFGASFVFRAVIEAFDCQDGLRKILNLLQRTINVRSGVSTNLMAPGIPRVDRGSSAEVLTASDKQITYHACVALRQYFRASFLILVDSLRACKNYRGALRNLSNPRKPIDVSNEAIETVVQQLSRDRKLGTAFVRAKWPALENFIFHNGHVTLLELTQAAPGEKYLHDIAQHALVVLHVVTLMPSARRYVVGSSLGNGRPGMSVILDAASGAAFGEPEVIQAALLILVNLVCPPPAFSSRSVLSTTPAGLVTPAPASVANGQNSEPKEKQARTDDCAGTSLALSSPASTIVGDTRISLGPGSGGPGLAAHMEQGYRFARESVRTNNGIKVLLHLLYPRTVLPPCAHDCIRALACRVLLGLARDEAIAQILTKLQVGKLLSELLRDGSHAHRQSSSGGDQDRWQTELSQVALDLIGIVTNAGRAGTVASEAAAPTLRRIERAAIAAATPINYHSRELLQLIHEHLLASGLTNTATSLLKEAKLTPLGSLLPVSSLSHSSTAQEIFTDQKEMQWPSGRIAGGALLGNKQVTEEDKMCMDRRRTPGKPLITPRKTINGKELQDSHTAGPTKFSGIDDSTWKTPRTLPMKRKAIEKDALPASPNKRPHLHTGASSGFSTPQVRFKNNFPGEATPSTSDMGSKPPMTQADDSVEHPSLPMCSPCYSHPSLLVEQKAERATLDTLVVQYLKHQHRQCPAPITTLPPLSLLHPHLCPEPSRLLYAPYNTTSRLASRETNPPYGGLHGRRHNRHFIYSRFRQVRVSRDEVSTLLTCATFLGQSGCLAAGCHSGSIRLFDINTGNIIENHQCHLTAVSVLQSASHLLSGDNGTGPLLLSSGTFDARLWNSSSMISGPLHTFENCKAARFNHAGTMIGALKPDSPKEVLLYDVNTYTLQQTLTESSISTGMSARNQPQPFVHFSPSDILVLWSGVLWDHRIPRAVHRFDQFTDYGGGGFHPAGNEVIINSEVWDLRTFKLLRSVPSLDQTVLTFNASGDVIYAILRRNADDVTTALQHKRTRHPLFSAFRTMDAVDYSDIATTQVDRCVLDLTTECSDSMIGLVAMEASQGLDSCVKFYEVGRKRPTDDDSDPDDGMDTDEEEESDVDDDDEHRLLDGDSESNEDGDDEDDDNVNEDFGLSDDNESEGGVPGGLLEIIDEDDDERTSYSEGSDTEFGDDEEFNGILQGFM